MINFTAKQIEQAIDILPLEAQEMLFSHNTELQIQEISDNAGLSDEQIGSLNVIANFIILGLISHKDLTREVKEELKIEDAKAIEVSQKVFREVLTPALEFKERVILEQKQREEQEKQDEEEYNELIEELEVDRILAKATGKTEDKKEGSAQGQEEAEETAESQKSKVESGGEGENVVERGEVPSYAPSRPLEKMPDVAPDNLPTGEPTVNSQQSIVNSEENSSLMPKLTPKTRPSDAGEVNSQQSIVNSENTHPFEEKMKKVFTSGGADISTLELPPIGSVPVAPRPSASDPYREPVE